MKMVIIKPPVIYLFAGSMIILNPYIHPYIWVQGYKAGYSNPVLCKHSGHKKMGNTFLRRDSNPFCCSQVSSAIYGNASEYSYPVDHAEFAHAQRSASSLMEMEFGMDFADRGSY